jgi:hypothetical protein
LEWPQDDVNVHLRLLDSGLKGGSTKCGEFVVWLFEFVVWLFEFVVWLFEFVVWLFEFVVWLFEFVVWLFEFVVWLFKERRGWRRTLYIRELALLNSMMGD